MKQLFEQFLREKEFLNGLSPRTIKYLGWVFNRWNDLIGEFPNKENTKEFVIKLSQSDISPFTTNSYIRGFDSFLTWLHENGHAEHLRLKKVKTGKRKPKTYANDELKKLFAYRPKTVAQTRTYTLMCLLIDTGIRIDEALTLRREKIDLQNLLITVIGKGNKERIVPISLECRKELFKFLRLHECDSVFSTKYGYQLPYRTSLQQFHELGRKVGVKGGWHKFRHTFASSYLRNGGNLIYLQRVLGHEDISVTKIYVEESLKDLSLMQKRTSLLSRLR